MQIPAAMFIEASNDELQRPSAEICEAIRKELREFHVANGAKVLDAPFPAGTPDVAKGYILGLQTARTLLRQSIAAQQAGCADIV